MHLPRCTRSSATLHAPIRHASRAHPPFCGWHQLRTELHRSALLTPASTCTPSSRPPQDDCTRFQQFPPGHFYNSKTGEFTRYYNPKYFLDFEAKPQRFPSAPYDPVALRQVR